ncbi:putative amp-CoA ligase [Laetiporus sulphureus 93-53]|uniref:Putative amp-CoA ligase n=1 Tax=Laetiporus sulphureus 93-53 TaxID=1314785 RepID=A0A165DWA8_9APHY|nr:putative amp-CoA ligase [Laetiporus sulphureus 93-53]KZT05761.1 putative amp-CoA ligase [Laetiporus sulphureus 93-53]
MSTDHFLAKVLPTLRGRAAAPFFRNYLGPGMEWGCITYESFAADVKAAISHWKGVLSGFVQPSSVVGLWLTGVKYEDILNILGVSASGHIPQLFSVLHANQDVVSDLLAMSNAEGLIVDARFAKAASSMKVPTFRALTLEEARKIEDAQSVELAMVSKADTAVIVHSSGTTSGAPKLIPTTHGLLHACLDFKYPSCLKQGSFDGPDTTNLLGSLAHVGSFQTVIRMAYHGDIIVQPSSPTFSTDELLAMVKKCGLNRIATYAPFLVQHIRRAKQDMDVLETLKGLRQILHTGVALNREEEKWAYEQRLPMTVMYGTTETAPLLISRLGGPPMMRLVSQCSARFIPFAGVTDKSSESHKALFEVVLPPDALDSPHISLFGEDGLYHTGDLLEEPEEGFYVHRGRTGDWIRMREGFIDSKSVEDHVRKTCSDLVHDVVVIAEGRPGPALLVESIRPNLSERERKQVAEEIVKRSKEFNARVFKEEQINNPGRILVLDKGQLPRTKEKGNIRRNAAQDLFAQEIDAMYTEQ